MLEIFIIIICITINAILAASETAFIALNKQTLRALSKKGDTNAQLTLTLRETPEKTLSIIQIGITFVGVFAAAIGGAGTQQNLTPWITNHFALNEAIVEMLIVLIVAIPLTYVSVVLGELVPKILALRRPLFIALRIAPWLSMAIKIFNPVVSLLGWSSKKIINTFTEKHVAEDDTEILPPKLEELLSPLNKQYIINMLKIERTTAKEIAIRWEDVAFVHSTSSIEALERTFITSGHTRLPVVEGKSVTGIIHLKEFLAFQKTNNKDWQSICRQPLSILETTPILTTLRLLQEKRAQMAIVYSTSAKTGIVTMESIFEEIIGDIYDEDDDGAMKKILGKMRYK